MNDRVNTAGLSEHPLRGQTMSGADTVVQVMADEGVRTVFGYSGGAILPIYDAGNIGMQRRKIWGVMADPEFDPRALVDCKPVNFKKSMEGLGVKENLPDPVLV